jgi:hypothetical protein
MNDDNREPVERAGVCHQITISLGFDADNGRIMLNGEPYGESLTGDILDQVAKNAFLSGYDSGFRSAGNYFPEQAWQRYRERMKDAQDSE